MDIRELDLDDDAEFAAWLAISTACNREVNPGFVPRSADDTKVLMAPPVGKAQRIDLVAVEDGQVRGRAMVWLPLEDNLHMAMVEVMVAAPFRRQGLGTQLLLASERIVSDERTTLVGGSVIPGDWDPLRDSGINFALARGYTISSRSTIRDLTWPAPRAQLEALRHNTPGYRLETYVDGIPARYRESYGVLLGLVDEEAPSGDIEWEASVISPDQYADDIAKVIETGGHQVETVALSQDEVVAFTSTYVPRDADRHMYVEGTLVRKDHRGHGLGLAVKVENYLRLLDEGYPQPKIETENDDDNVWMVRLNEQMGFLPTQQWIGLQKKR